MLTIIERLALIIITFSFIKLIVLGFNPKAWMNFAEFIWKKPKLTQVICLLLSAVVFFYLIDNGITIIQIFAIILFVVLFMAVGIAPEVKELIKDYKAKIKRGSLWKQYWLYVLLWLLILIWGIKEIFLK